MSGEIIFTKDNSLIGDGIPAPDIMEFPEASALCRTIRAPGLGLRSIKERVRSALSWHREGTSPC